MTIPGFHRGVVVAFTPEAFSSCLDRFRQWDVVITWEECRAWARGVEAVSPALRPGRTLEALTFFCQRQGIKPY